MSDRCTGHCCRDFTLPYSPDELWQSYNAFLAMRNGEVPVQVGDILYRSQPRIPQDIHLIAPMVTYLGHYDTPASQNTVPEVMRLEHHYTCKHYDAATHNCTIYDIRPAMCREYPYGHGCNYAACTWESQRRKPRALPVVDNEKIVKKESLLDTYGLGEIKTLLDKEAVKP